MGLGAVVPGMCMRPQRCNPPPQPTAQTPVHADLGRALSLLDPLFEAPSICWLCLALAPLQRGRISEKAPKWISKFIKRLNPSADSVLQQEAVLAVTALASMGAAHRNALTAAGVLPALSACLASAAEGTTTDPLVGRMP